jgi:hypothetical protein
VFKGRPFGDREFPGFNFGTMPWRAFYFDKKRQALYPTEEQILEREYSYSIGEKNRDFPKNKFYVECVSDNKEDGRKFKRYQLFLNFKAPEGNPFTDDPRPGVYFSSALRVLWTPEMLQAAGEELKEYFTDPNSEESHRFFYQLADTCNSAWMPEYWKFIKGLAGIKS